MRWPRCPRMIGRGCCTPTPVTSSPGCDRNRSATVFGRARCSATLSITETGAGVVNTGFGDRVAVTMIVSNRYTVVSVRGCCAAPSPTTAATAPTTAHARAMCPSPLRKPPMTALRNRALETPRLRVRN